MVSVPRHKISLKKFLRALTSKVGDVFLDVVKDVYQKTKRHIVSNGELRNRLNFSMRELFDFISLDLLYKFFACPGVRL